MLVRVSPNSNTDEDKFEQVTRQLLRELKELDIEPIKLAAGEAPVGSKGAELTTLSEWLLTASASGGAITIIMATLRDWLSSRSRGSKVSVTIEGDTIELDAASDAETRALLEAFIARHERGR
jgi:hypothetical protein